MSKAEAYLLSYQEIANLEVAGDGFVYKDGAKVAQLKSGSIKDCAGKKLNRMGLIVYNGATLGIVMRIRFKKRQPRLVVTAPATVPSSDHQMNDHEDASYVLIEHREPQDGGATPITEQSDDDDDFIVI